MDETSTDQPRDSETAGRRDSPQRAQGKGRVPLSYVARRTVRNFGADACTDQAAALTYFSVQSIFPAALALLSLLGLFGADGKSLRLVNQVLRPLVSPSTLRNLHPILEHLTTFHGAGITLILGLVGALWSASGYVGAFGRAMNRIYDVQEGRPFWLRKPLMLLITTVTIAMCALVLLILVVSGPVASSVGGAIGMGTTTLQIWDIAKWPVLALVVVLVVALLYFATPNVRMPKLRWLSAGAILAILVWLLGSIGFAFYVTNFSHFDKTYGSITGVIVALLWLWLTNIALLLGAELDAELERRRQLEAGIAAEEHLQLPVRDDRGIHKQDRALGRMVDKANAFRSGFGRGNPDDRPYRRR